MYHMIVQGTTIGTTMDVRKVLFFVASGLFVGMLFKYYWRFQMMYNSSILSFYTPDSFPVSEEKEEEYDRITDEGEKYAKTQRVVIAALVRDIADRVPEIQKKVERMGSLYKDYRVLIVENDSSDGTRERLLDWGKINKKVVVLGCGYNEQVCKLPKTPKTDGHGVDRPRIEKMTRLRNIYLDEIKKNYSDWDYVLMWDLDMLGSVYLDGVCHSMGLLKKDVDLAVVCAYGIYRWAILTLFYDTYALLHLKEDFHIDEKTIHDIRKGWWEAKYQRGDAPFEVDSCFSGFAIYRTSAIVGDDVKYDMTPPPNLECEHVRLNKKIKGKKIVNPSMINLVLLND